MSQSLANVDLDRFHEFWRLQLLDELQRRLVALEWEPALDPSGSRRDALQELIQRFELIEAEDLRRRREHGQTERQVGASPEQDSAKGAASGPVSAPRAATRPTRRSSRATTHTLVARFVGALARIAARRRD